MFPLTLTSAMPEPDAAGATYTVRATAEVTRTALMIRYTRNEAKYEPRLAMVSTAQNLKPEMFSTPMLTAKAAMAVHTPVLKGVEIGRTQSGG